MVFTRPGTARLNRALLGFSLSIPLSLSCFAEEVSVSIEDRLERLVGGIEALRNDRGAEFESALKMLGLSPDESVLASAEEIEFFENSVRPIFAENCYSCHGEKKQNSDLRTDSRKSLLLGGQRGPALAPGDPQGSRIIQAVRHEGELKMPPENPLYETDVQTLVRWVEMGAPWPADSAQSEIRSMDERLKDARETHWAFGPVEAPAVPSTSESTWVKNPIDAFVLNRLEEAGLEPSSQAEAKTLLRRLNYDLIGLPPSYEESEEFCAEFNDDSYVAAVDRLLDSPHYGERWGRHWLDLARYSDTKGYVFQENRNYPYSHTYRDYVIRAFSEDLPYDRFLVEQLAADRLDLGEDKRPLAAMGFLTLGRRFINNVHDIVDDRIDVVTRGMLGLTVTCARCHEHKYDPIPTEDYYSLYGVFRSCEEPQNLPLIEEPDPEDPDYVDFVAKKAVKEAHLEKFISARHQKILAEARKRTTDYLLAAVEVWKATNPSMTREVAARTKLKFELINAWKKTLKKRAQPSDPVFAPLAAYLAPMDEDVPGKINPLIAKALEPSGATSANEVARRIGKTVEVANESWRDLLVAKTQVAMENGTSTIEIPAGLEDPNAEALRKILYAADSPANPSRDRIRRLLSGADQGKLRKLKADIQEVEATHKGRPDRAMVLVDRKNLFNPFVFRRGKPGNKGKAVPRRFLAALSGEDREPFREGSGRLELARAIVSPTNPLTARVWVNRVWGHHFGKPLVGSTSDFGLRGDPPTHPELLDYLARRFMDEGWSTKKLHRLILTSNTYRQSSAARDAGLAADPTNRLIWRQNRRRLDFESLRDSLLLASGGLELAPIGGYSQSITEPPYGSRRTVYARVERQNLPGLFRTFDFASPDAHTPRRHRTTVPQQALFLMNSPFMAGQAKALVGRATGPDNEDPVDLTDRLYRILFQRAPDPIETDLCKRFLQSQQTAPPPPGPPAPVWRYGYGWVDEASDEVASFTPLPHFADGTWKGGKKLPDAHIGWVSLHRTGGHPGDATRASIRRWVSPVSATVSFTSHIEHGDENGDGVVAYLVSSRSGILWQERVHNERIQAEVFDIPVVEGDFLDLVVARGETTTCDSYTWHPRIWVGGEAEKEENAREWLSRLGFEGPPPPAPEPLKPREAFAQALLLTNEFIFVD